MKVTKTSLKLIIIILTYCASNIAHAQWTNHYKKLDDFGHHVYLEQHELPILADGITDPAPSPDGKTIAISSKGWLWLLDINSGVATRLTYSNATDARPRWSPDGAQIAFVRDDGSDTSIVIKDINSGDEKTINTPSIELDPEFSDNGKTLFYTSGKTGSLELYQYDIATNSEQQITTLPQVVRNVRRVSNSNSIVYLHGNSEHRVLRLKDFDANTDVIVRPQTLTYHLTNDIHSTQRLMVFSSPIDNDYHLYTMDLDEIRVAHRLTDGNSFALTPAFSAKGDYIYYTLLAENRQFKLMRIPTYGGDAEEVKVNYWNYGVDTGSLTVSVLDEKANNTAARISIRSSNGHPVPSSKSATFKDPQSGRNYLYIDGQETFTLPIGDYIVEAVRGPMSKLVSDTVTVKADVSTNLNVEINQLWNSKEAGYTSADFHIHLNGDGHHRATHEDALLLMKGENLDYLAPMSWNRWERKIDKPLIGKVSSRDGHKVVQGQEVRSHYHGHVGLVNVNKPFNPWFFGPFNPALGNINMSNADVFAYANKVGAFGTYVHPIGSDGDPFSEDLISSIPMELISDGVLEPKMGLELVCAWTSSLGTAEVWYRLLNIGQPVSAISGTDSWVDFHRTPAVGTARAYVRNSVVDDNVDSAVAGAIAGKSFLTTGPALIFELDNGAKPGDVTIAGEQSFSLTISSAVSLEIIEVLVNGQVVDTFDGLTAGETRSYKGKVNLPNGGWVAARAYAKEQRQDSWPTMHARAFAHSSPIWINKIGSTDQQALRLASADLLRAIDAAETKAREWYGDRQVPKLYQRFEDARQKLNTLN